MKESNFTKFAEINVNDYVKTKGGMSYLPWADAWSIFVSIDPNAIYEVIKAPNGMPYFASESGAVVYTKMTSNGITHEMWLPVMDSNNKTMKDKPYKYMTRNGERTVDAYTMFDINKTVMRCLVKNMAMFGLGLYLYRGEDLPSEPEKPANPAPSNPVAEAKIRACKTPQELAAAWVALSPEDRKAVAHIKDELKEKLA